MSTPSYRVKFFTEDRHELNFSKLLQICCGPFGDRNTPYSPPYNYVGEKPGGTDVGHVIKYNKDNYIIKTGIVISLLEQALQRLVKMNKELFSSGDMLKVGKHLKKIEKIFQRYIPSNYERLNSLTDEQRIEVGKDFESVFSYYTEKTDEGKQLCAQLLKTPNPTQLTIHDVYKVYLYFAKHLNKLSREVLITGAFMDVINGSFSQYINNQFQRLSNPHIATHWMLEEYSPKNALLQASKVLDLATGFDSFLLAPLKTMSISNQSNMDRLCVDYREKLNDSLKGQTIKGLCAAILLRHILGESADNGADNQLLMMRNNTWQLVNIDLTGFRLDRRHAWKDRLGWEETLRSNDEQVLLNRLFDESVYSDRFIVKYVEGLGLNDEISKRLQKALRDVVMDVLQNHVAEVVCDEIQQLRQWFAKLNMAQVKKDLNFATHDAYEHLHYPLRFDKNILQALIDRNETFITAPIEVARAYCSNTEENDDSSPSLNMSL